jgi:hypothetical protein
VRIFHDAKIHLKIELTGTGTFGAGTQIAKLEGRAPAAMAKFGRGLHCGGPLSSAMASLLHRRKRPVMAA